jgi:hypothetical protein
MDGDDGQDRGYNTVTFLIATVLAVIVLGAIGYGVFHSSHVTTAIPAMTPGELEPPSTTGAR